MLTQKEAAELVKYCYENGDFEKLFPHMTQSYEHMSFWVLEVLRGKEKAVNYYTGKGDAIRKAGAPSKGTLVRILKAPDKVRPNGMYRGGVRMIEDPACCHRQDEGKIAVRFCQYVEQDGGDVFTLAIPTLSEDGMLSQLLITEPGFYEIEEL